MKKHPLTASVRSVTGKNVKHLREKGLIPATVYGKGIASISIECPIKELSSVIKEAGESGLVYLTVGDTTHPTLIHTVQRHPVTDEILHVEFHEVNLKETTKTNVPIVLTGEPLAVKEGMGTLLQITTEIEVEALPTDLPEKIEIDVAHLAQVNDMVQVKDIPAIKDVTFLTDGEQLIVKIGELLKPEPVETPVVAEGAEAAAEGEEGKAEEGKEGTEEKKEETPEKAPEK